MALPLINGTAYSWSQIELRLFNTVVNGITAIQYEDDQVIEDNKGAGNRPVSRGYGSIECKGSITLEMGEVEALQAASPTGRLQDIPEFDIPVSFLPQGGVIRNHILHNCRFKKNMRDTKTGDTNIPVELPLIISHISWK